MTTKVAGAKLEKKKVAVQEPITLIRQKELIAYIRIKNQIETLSDELDNRATELKNLLGAGVPVEKGTHIAQVNMTERRNVSWKDEAISLADVLKGAGQGEVWAQEVLDRTDPTPMTKLVVK